MSTATITRQAPPSGTGNGGVPARRAVIRWAWRLFRREWRQQLLVLALIIVAVAATVLGAAVATNTPPAANAGFGTAQDLATYSAPDPHLASQIAALQQRFGPSTSSRTRRWPFPARSRATTCGPRIPTGRSAARCSSCSAGTIPARPARSR